MNPYWSFMEPLDARAAAEWGADWRTKFSGASMDELQLVSEIGGKPGEALYLPGNVQLLGWLINDRDAFEAPASTPRRIATFDDLMAACATLKAADKTAILLGGHPAGLVDLYQSFVEISRARQDGAGPARPGELHRRRHDAAFDMITRIYNECAQEGAIARPWTRPCPASSSAAGAASASSSRARPGSASSPMRRRRRRLHGQPGGTFLVPGSKGLAATDAGVGVVAASQNKDAAWEIVKWIAAGAENQRLADRGEPMAFLEHPPAGKGTDFDTFVQKPLIDALATGDNKFRRILCADVYNALDRGDPGRGAGPDRRRGRRPGGPGRLRPGLRGVGASAGLGHHDGPQRSRPRSPCVTATGRSRTGRRDRPCH